MHGFWVASLQVWPRWALTVIRFVEKYFTCVKDPKNSGQSLVAALQSRPPLTLTINTIRDYVSMYMQLFTPLYVTSHHYDICTTQVPSYCTFILRTNEGKHVRGLSLFRLTGSRATSAHASRLGEVQLGPCCGSEDNQTRLFLNFIH